MIDRLPCTCDRSCNQGNSKKATVLPNTQVVVN